MHHDLPRPRMTTNMPKNLPRDVFALAIMGVMTPMLIIIELFRPGDET